MLNTQRSDDGETPKDNIIRPAADFSQRPSIEPRVEMSKQEGKWIESSPSDDLADHLMTNEENMVDEEMMTFSKPEEQTAFDNLFQQRTIDECPEVPQEMDMSIEVISKVQCKNSPYKVR